MTSPSGISSSVEVFKVPLRFVPKLWPCSEHWIEASLKFAPPWWTLEGIYKKAIIGDYAMWLALKNDIPHGVALAEIDLYDKALVCAVPWIGGKWVPQIQSEVEKWAKSCGCSYVMGGGRRGWIRKAGMQEAGVILIKEL